MFQDGVGEEGSREEGKRERKREGEEGNENGKGVTYFVGVQRLKELDGDVEEIDNLFLRHIIGVARRVERADASTVLGPVATTHQLPST